MKALQDFSPLRCCRHIMIQKLKGYACLACGVGSLPLAMASVSCRWWDPLHLCRKWANVHAVRQTQLGLCWENSNIYTLHGDRMLRPPTSTEAYLLNEDVWVVWISQTWYFLTVFLPSILPTYCCFLTDFSKEKGITCLRLWQFGCLILKSDVGWWTRVWKRSCCMLKYWYHRWAIKKVSASLLLVLTHQLYHMSPSNYTVLKLDVAFWP